jgi:hypothetical protein
MLSRLFRRRPRLTLRFEQRECVMAPQTPARYALHADVHMAAAAAEPASVDDAWLEWHAGASVIRRSRWDRAVIDGRFRYPPEPLAFKVDARAGTLTLTFNDALIPHGQEPPPLDSVLTLELALGEGPSVRRDLWQVRLTSWDAPAEARWLVESR